MTTDTKILYLIFAIVVLFLLYDMYEQSRKPEPTKLPEEIKKEQVLDRMKVTDTLAVVQEKKAEAAIKKKDHNLKHYIEVVKPEFKNLPADSSVKLLENNLKEYEENKKNL